VNYFNLDPNRLRDAVFSNNFVFERTESPRLYCGQELLRKHTTQLASAWQGLSILSTSPLWTRHFWNANGLAAAKESADGHRQEGNDSAVEV
jgi:hypothetical protein